MAALFSYVELQTPNAEQAQAFYGALFGWKFSKVPVPHMTYLSVAHGADQRGGVMEGTRPPHWLAYVNVDNLVDALTRAQTLGAKVLQPATVVPGQGSMAVLADPTGATFALWQQAA